MSFVHTLKTGSAPSSFDPVFLLHGDRMVTRTGADGRVEFPGLRDVGKLSVEQTLTHVGRLDGRSCWLASFSSDVAVPDSWSWGESRALVGAFSPDQWQALSCARELAYWRQRHRFCGCCGTATVDDLDERVLRCPKCEAQYFPNPAPAVIVAVTQGDRILLAHNRNFRTGVFSTLAGFVDPGETAEQAVVREVREETGVTVGALRYVTSQPWPFPNSLMLGFRAEYVSGEIAVDGKEIVKADWFSRAALPEIPRVGTVARLLIDGWLAESRA